MIKEVLGVGETEAKTTFELAEHFGMTTREVRDLVRRERLGGAAICSSNSGYYLPRTLEELKETIRVLYLKGDETRRVADAMSKIVIE